MNVIELPAHWRDRAVIVTGEPPGDVVAPPECTTEKRRREWRLSRGAARLLPVRAFVSYSHSHPYAAAAAADEPVGIDVQTIRAVKPGITHLFLTDVEEEVLRSCTLPNALLHFWCAKEAEFKRRRGETVTLKQTPVAFQRECGDGLVFAGVETIALGDAIAALTGVSS